MKHTFSAIILLALAAAVFPGTSAHAQSVAPTIFQVVPTPNQNSINNQLFAAAASSPNDIWAVGQTVIHFDGNEWSVVPAPGIGGNNLSSNLLGVVDISPTLAWAVGNLAQPGDQPQQVIEQWNGTEWSIFPGPKFPPNSQAILQAITATSANDIWAVGSFGEGIFPFCLFEHFNGTAWTAQVVKQTDLQNLLSVSADAPNDAWAVGTMSGNPLMTFATHWDGTNWTGLKHMPNVGTGNNQLNAVLALAPNNVWAVGFSTPTAAKQSQQQTLIEHFDGTAWSVVPSPNVGSNDSQANHLMGLTANSPDDIWAFGSFISLDGLRTMTLVLHWDGTSWTIVSSPDPTKGFLDDVLNAGVVPSPGNVWIFGTAEEGRGIGFGTLALHTAKGADSSF